MFSYLENQCEAASNRHAIHAYFIPLVSVWKSYSTYLPGSVINTSEPQLSCGTDSPDVLLLEFLYIITIRCSDDTFLSILLC